jgi:peptidoglycan hydrolase CwlO-like protein
MSITDAERISKLEGRVEELSKRIDDLRNDINHRFAIVQWEVRVWFLVLMALITILTFLKP